MHRITHLFVPPPPVQGVGLSVASSGGQRLARGSVVADAAAAAAGRCRWLMRLALAAATRCCPAARSIRDGSGSTSGGGGSATGGQGGDAPEEEAIVEFNDVSFHYPSAQPGSGIKHLWVC